MANFTQETFTNHDDYMTPKDAWEDIKEYIPKDKIIWEPFYGNGKSGEYLSELGFNVIHQNIDFFQNDLGEIIVSNPPFSQCEKVLERLKEIGKPFILILPSSKINTQYFRKLFKDDIQIIIPKKRINFIRTPLTNKKSSCNFDCFYYCYKINLENGITWLFS